MTATITNPAPVRISPTRYQVASRTAAGVVYSVIRVAGGWQCNCAAAMNSRDCWHRDAVLMAEWNTRRKSNEVCTARPARQLPDPALGMALLLGKGR